ncbi:hypothetical protein ACFX19_025975 [Malus domestica]
MPNGSLESLLFQKSPIVLNWKTGYHIAVGTARGLAYLHHSCRKCIIHCDIKPENILLDAEYAPKIADFGLAKLVSRDFSRIITTMQGQEGILLRNGYQEKLSQQKPMSLATECCVLRSYQEGETEIFWMMDCKTSSPLALQMLEGNANKEEVMRACKVSCWCIQDDENDRRTMGQVDQLLEGVIDLGIPPIPQFLDRFSKSLVESIHYHNIYSSTASDSRRGYSSSITISGA